MQLSAHQSGDNLGTQTTHYLALSQAFAVVANQHLQSGPITLGGNRNRTVTFSQAMLNSVSDQLRQHRNQGLGGVATDHAKPALQLDTYLMVTFSHHCGLTQNLTENLIKINDFINVLTQRIMHGGDGSHAPLRLTQGCLRLRLLSAPRLHTQQRRDGL